jgi:hypothetical protein
MATEQEHYDAARKYQAYYDDFFRQVGERAPQPTLGQSLNDYRRETLRTAKKRYLPQTHQLYSVQCRALPADALNVLEPQILTSCVAEAQNPAHVPPGEIRKLERLDDTGRVRFIDWIGEDCFVKQMMRPGRRVVSFRTPQAAVDANGRFLR